MNSNDDTKFLMIILSENKNTVEIFFKENHEIIKNGTKTNKTDKSISILFLKESITLDRSINSK